MILSVWEHVTIGNRLFDLTGCISHDTRHLNKVSSFMDPLIDAAWRKIGLSFKAIGTMGYTAVSITNRVPPGRCRNHDGKMHSSIAKAQPQFTAQHAAWAMTEGYSSEPRGLGAKSSTKLVQNPKNCGPRRSLGCCPGHGDSRSPVCTWGASSAGDDPSSCRSADSLWAACLRIERRSLPLHERDMPR